MAKQDTSFFRKYGFAYAQAGAFVFYGLILTLIALAELPTVTPENFSKREALLAGKDFVFPEPGAQFSVFKPYLPGQGALSFLMDAPYRPYSSASEQLYMAQSYLAPLLLNANPVENVALVYCSQGTVAHQRLSDMGYQLKLALADGKGVAEKK